MPPDSTRNDNDDLTFYPSYTYKHSPTFDKWCKLTARDIHEVLTDRRGHDGLRHLWFYLNHPVQYVDVTAPVVAIEPLGSGGGNGGKYALVTLDDGSGAVIGVKITRLVVSSSAQVDKGKANSEDGQQEEKDDGDDGGDDDTAEAQEPHAEHSIVTAAKKAETVYSSATTVDNVQIHTGLGHFSITIDGTPIDIGTVMRAKGTIGTWWDTRQIELLRASIVKSTRKEIESWRELARCKALVLSSPWKLSQRSVKRAQREWEDEQDREKQARQRWNEYQRRKRERQVKAEAAYELLRRKQEVQMNEGALI